MSGNSESNKKGAATKLKLAPDYFVTLGAKGGRKATHRLDSETARAMVRKRWAKAKENS